MRIEFWSEQESGKILCCFYVSGECESGFSFLGIGNQILSSVALFSVLEVEEIGAGTYSHVVLTHILVWNLSIYFQCHTQT